MNREEPQRPVRLRDLLVRHPGLTACIALAIFMAYLDGTIVNIALPTMGTEFDADSSTVVWVSLVYMLVQSSTLVLIGRIADVHGLKRVFRAGLLVFTAGSLASGLAPSIAWLIAARSVQGLGGSALIIAAFTMVSRHLAPHLAGIGFGVITTAAALGAAVGAPLGGFLTTWLSWPWIFYINLPIGLFAYTLAARAVPADPPPEEPGPRDTIDYPGAFLALAGIFCVLYGINQVDVAAWTSARVIGLLFLGLAFLALLARRELSCRAPLLDLRLFANRRFRHAMLAAAAAYALLSGILLLMPFYLECVQDLSSVRSGLVLLGYSVPLILVGPIAGALISRHGARLLCLGAMGLAACACLGFALALSWPGAVAAGIFMALCGIAYGLFNAPNNNHINSIVPPEQRGVVFAAVQTAVRFSMALGVSFFEAVFTFRLPIGHDLADGLHELPREMMVFAFQRVFVIGAAFCLAAMVFSWLSTRKPQ